MSEITVMFCENPDCICHVRVSNTYLLKNVGNINLRVQGKIRTFQRKLVSQPGTTNIYLCKACVAAMNVGNGLIVLNATTRKEQS